VINTARWLRDDYDDDDAQIAAKMIIKTLLLKVLLSAVRHKHKNVVELPKNVFLSEHSPATLLSQNSPENYLLLESQK